MSDPSDGVSRFPLWVAPLIVIAIVLPAIWPSDAPFMGDEPNLIHKAIEANAHGRLESVGLMGTRGLPYGPLPTWIYQLMLIMTSHLRAMVVVRALLFSLMVAASLIWLARVTRWHPVFIPVVLLSPYFWYAARPLWDNSFAVPFGALALVAYASFIDRPRGRTLAMALLGIVALFLTHLMTLALIVPILAHLVILQRRELRQHWKSAVTAVVIGAIACWPYCSAIVSTHGKPLITASGWNGLWFALLGPRIISGANLSAIYDPAWRGSGPLTALIIAAQGISLIAYPLVWGGIAIVVCRLTHRRRDEGRSLSTANHVGLLAAATVIAQLLLNAAYHVFGHPHYYNGTWIVFPVLAWIAVDAVIRSRPTWGMIVPLAHGAALATISIYLMFRMHTLGGVRNLTYGVSLGNQVDAVRELNRLGCIGPFVFVDANGNYVTDPFITEGRVMAIRADLTQWQFYPFHANEIQKLNPPSPAMMQQQPPAGVRVGYLSNDEADSRIGVFKE